MTENKLDHCDGRDYETVRIVWTKEVVQDSGSLDFATEEVEIVRMGVGHENEGQFCRI